MRTFIVRLQEEAGGSDRMSTTTLRLRGVVDDVATGTLTTFRNDQELVTALLIAVGASSPSPTPAGTDRTPRGPSSDSPSPTPEEK